MSKEVILEINDTFDGFIIKTNKQEITLEMGQGGCCAISGYFFTPDNTEEFIGAEVIDIKMVDEALADEQIQMNEGYCVFVNIETDKGVLQFTAYNDHNGYYSASGRVVSKQLTEDWSI